MWVPGTCCSGAEGWTCSASRRLAEETRSTLSSKRRCPSLRRLPALRQVWGDLACPQLRTWALNEVTRKSLNVSRRFLAWQRYGSSVEVLFTACAGTRRRHSGSAGGCLDTLV